LPKLRKEQRQYLIENESALKTRLRSLVVYDRSSCDPRPTPTDIACWEEFYENMFHARPNLSLLGRARDGAVGLTEPVIVAQKLELRAILDAYTRLGVIVDVPTKYCKELDKIIDDPYLYSKSILPPFFRPEANYFALYDGEFPERFADRPRKWSLDRYSESCMTLKEYLLASLYFRETYGYFRKGPEATYDYCCALLGTRLNGGHFPLVRFSNPQDKSSPNYVHQTPRLCINLKHESEILELDGEKTFVYRTKVYKPLEPL
jgi:hypothetical protein